MSLTSEQRLAALKQIAEAAVEAERATLCPAALSAAQCILESGWLQHCPGNNCFGIKDTDRWPGAVYTVTKEFINGTWRELKLAFESYPTLADCFIDHGILITGGFNLARPNCYFPAWSQYQQDGNLGEYIRQICRLYATDPNYEAKVLALTNSQSVLDAIALAWTNSGGKPA